MIKENKVISQQQRLPADRLQKCFVISKDKDLSGNNLCSTAGKSALCGGITMKKIQLLAGLLMSAAVLGGCSGTEDAAGQEAAVGEKPQTEQNPGTDRGTDKGTEANIGQEAASEPQTLSRRLFVNAPNAWVGDLMGMAHENGIDLNYLYETDYNGVAYHPIHRFTTNNLIEYVDAGEVLPCGTELEDRDLAVGTGSFFQAEDGTYHCFYTGHNDRAESLGIGKECIMHAVSTDNLEWTKVLEDTMDAPEEYDSNDFRDPFVFWNEEESCYWMLAGARKPGKNGGFLAKFTSTDLKQWEIQEPFYDQEELYFLECPDVFQINDWYYLLFSWNNVTYYRMARSLEGPWETPETDTFDGNAFYAAKTVEYQGTRYLFGFVDRKKDGNDSLDYTWAGSICPYELVQQENGTLGVSMPHQYQEEYFTKELTLPDGKAVGSAKQDRNTVILDAADDIAGMDFQTLPETMLLTCKVTLEENVKGAGFAFGREDDFTEAKGILLDLENNCIHYDRCSVREMQKSQPENTCPFPFREGETVDVKVVVENEVIVVYLDDKKALSNRIYQSQGKGWGIFALQGKAVFSDIRIFVPES